MGMLDLAEIVLQRGDTIMCLEGGLPISFGGLPTEMERGPLLTAAFFTLVLGTALGSEAGCRICWTRRRVMQQPAVPKMSDLNASSWFGHCRHPVVGVLGGSSNAISNHGAGMLAICIGAATISANSMATSDSSCALHATPQSVQLELEGKLRSREGARAGRGLRFCVDVVATGGRSLSCMLAWVSKVQGAALVAAGESRSPTMACWRLVMVPAAALEVASSSLVPSARALAGKCDFVQATSGHWSMVQRDESKVRQVLPVAVVKHVSNASFGGAAQTAAVRRH
ncbi:MAG: hypothetical protein FRX49_05593 [Trebouxia sp. A1-2]|nr:MAG: hypothetical protein FRX49_05593 [Trebouxia sp. A1-2]